VVSRLAPGRAAETATGDRADVPDGVSDGLWSQVSVSSAECPGARRCAFGDACFAERAKAEALGLTLVESSG
jgi:ATP-dependent DNA helicase DinG